MNLPAEFENRMRGILKGDFGKFAESYSKPAEKGIRVNTLKITVEDFKKISPFNLEQVPWEESGFYVTAEYPGKTVQHAAGLYYVQEPSALSPAPELEAKSGERVLDLCSAPGGKGTQLAQYMRGGGILFLNEINFRRAKILSSNVERLGVKNAAVTCASPERLCVEFKEYFDKILVDAPCSGEGMFKKEDSAISEWSLDNVKFCAARQAVILDCAYEMLSCGGRMVYSTCTFAPEEDELQVENFISSHSDCKLLKIEKLFPHEIRGEGHFFATIEKFGGGRRDKRAVTPTVKDKKLLSEYRKWESENLKTELNNLHVIGDTLYSLPENFPEYGAQTLRAGIRIGGFAGGRFEPSHSLAMCLKKEEARGIELDEESALAYLRGLTFDCSDGNGWYLALCGGFPLGWCKASCGTAKNKLPKGLRI